MKEAKRKRAFMIPFYKMSRIGKSTGTTSKVPQQLSWTEGIEEWEVTGKGMKYYTRNMNLEPLS